MFGNFISVHSFPRESHYSMVRLIDEFRKVCCTDACSVIGNPPSSSPVSCLLGTCRPPHVTRFVAAVVVWVSVYGVQCRWSGTDMLEERLEPGFATPLLTDRDSSCTVIRKTRIPVVLTSLYHCCPCLVLGRVNPPVCDCAGGFETSARTHAACIKGVRRCGKLLSAIAHTIEITSSALCVFAYPVRESQYHALSISLTSHVFDSLLGRFLGIASTGA